VRTINLRKKIRTLLKSQKGGSAKTGEWFRQKQTFESLLVLKEGVGLMGLIKKKKRPTSIANIRKIRRRS